MKACYVNENSDFEIRSVPCPKPKAGEVLLRVKACGICGSDVPRVFGKKAYYYPIVLGHEFSGLIENAENQELIGRKAAVFPLIPCGKCPMCEIQEYAQCHNYDYFGSRRDGALEEYLAVDEWNLVLLPENISYEEAAMCEPVAVALHAISNANVNAGDSVLIYGAGPIGILAGQWAKAAGASKIMYSDIDKRKLEFAESFGFSVYDETEKADVVIEGSGASAALNNALNAVKSFGTVLLLGNAATDMNIAQVNYQYILRKQITLKGSWNSSFSQFRNDWHKAIQAISEGIIDVKPLITHRFGLEECDKGFALAKDKNDFYCKIMILC